MHIRILPVALLTAASLWVAPLSAQAQVVRAIASIDGLTCPFCAFSAEKQLKKVGGVQRITVDVDKGTATLVARSGQSIDVEQIPGAIKAAGFAAKGVRIVALGTVVSQGQGLRLQLQGQSRNLPPGDAPGWHRCRQTTSGPAPANPAGGEWGLESEGQCPDA